MGKKVLVVGAVALGSKAACRLKRLEPDAEVLLIDQDEHISYGGCGIPYYVSGDVADASELQSTSFHMLRDERFFKDCKDIDVMTRTRVTAIHRNEKKIEIEKMDGTRSLLPYDQLVIGTGSRVRDLKIEGQKLGGIYSVGSLRDAIAIKSAIASGQAGTAVVVGAGFIGLEMAEALADMWGLDTTVVEISDQIMPGFVGPELAKMAQSHMEKQGVVFRLGESVVRFEGEDGRVARVVTDKETLEADIVIIAAGILPNGELAAAAGLEVGFNGGILVDDHMRTTDPDIYAGGDCVLVPNAITGKPGYYPLGSLSNRQGRVIGDNLAGKNSVSPPVVGSFVVKLFETCLCGAGLTLKRALEEGFDAISVRMCQLDRAHFYPTKELMYLELVVDRSTRQVLGIQGSGSKGDATVGRINAVAALLARKPKVEDISNLEFAYSPPFSSAMDIVNALANVADNILDDRMHPIGCEEFAERWEEIKRGDVCLIDCRAKADAKVYEEKYPGIWKGIPQDELLGRLDELPEGKPLVLICNTGVRSYEAQLNLRAKGHKDNVTVFGGVAMLKHWGMDI
ncbi:FAD-dependent oxidoreductase [Desulfobotulus mexicanus]|uniref:Pyridine nucleotide-disulfide oxidoreductase n=1 Tax=Desulfobotulus mexicanus TaxID=2586642 RepID=A0A5S5MFX9_9BACT|nr:FAD-dependent oxidoreductase [Desulfobotulus mexicanus]TYT74589.1 pyridine nucleotide-disulfide oxidoreductase [Desulfobotulus mexicanus]